jgi:transcriptional regulator with XRE-family HTH domain
MLLGATTGSKVSRYENFSRMPALDTLWAYEIVFDQPARELFAGQYEVIRAAVRARARRLLKRLIAQGPGAPPPGIARKVAILRLLVEPKLPAAE